MVCDDVRINMKGKHCACLNPYSIGIWSATPLKLTIMKRNYYVLILILLEYGLRQMQQHRFENLYLVLILILLEYGLRHTNKLLKWKQSFVLILILLEYGLRLANIFSSLRVYAGLNPYSIGIWSATYVGNG